MQNLIHEMNLFLQAEGALFDRSLNDVDMEQEMEIIQQQDAHDKSISFLEADRNCL